MTYIQTEEIWNLFGKASCFGFIAWCDTYLQIFRKRKCKQKSAKINNLPRSMGYYQFPFTTDNCFRGSSITPPPPPTHLLWLEVAIKGGATTAHLNKSGVGRPGNWCSCGAPLAGARVNLRCAPVKTKRFPTQRTRRITLQWFFDLNEHKHRQSWHTNDGLWIVIYIQFSTFTVALLMYVVYVLYSYLFILPLQCI